MFAFIDIPLPYNHSSGSSSDVHLQAVNKYITSLLFYGNFSSTFYCYQSAATTTTTFCTITIL